MITRAELIIEWLILWYIMYPYFRSSYPNPAPFPELSSPDISWAGARTRLQGQAGALTVWIEGFMSYGLMGMHSQCLLPSPRLWHAIWDNYTANHIASAWQKLVDTLNEFKWIVTWLKMTALLSFCCSMSSYPIFQFHSLSRWLKREATKRPTKVLIDDFSITNTMYIMYCPKQFPSNFPADHSRPFCCSHRFAVPRPTCATPIVIGWSDLAKPYRCNVDLGQEIVPCICWLAIELRKTSLELLSLVKSKILVHSFRVTSHYQIQQDPTITIPFLPFTPNP